MDRTLANRMINLANDLEDQEIADLLDFAAKRILYQRFQLDTYIKTVEELKEILER